MSDPAWGDMVRVRALAPRSMRPGALAAVVGVREVQTVDQAAPAGTPAAISIYTIEFGDGLSIDIAQAWIERVVAEDT